MNPAPAGETRERRSAVRAAFQRAARFGCHFQPAARHEPDPDGEAKRQRALQNHDPCGLSMRKYVCAGPTREIGLERLPHLGSACRMASRMTSGYGTSKPNNNLTPICSVSVRRPRGARAGKTEPRLLVRERPSPAGSASRQERATALTALLAARRSMPPPHHFA